MFRFFTSEKLSVGVALVVAVALFWFSPNLGGVKTVSAGEQEGLHGAATQAFCIQTNTTCVDANFPAGVCTMSSQTSTCYSCVMSVVNWKTCVATPMAGYICTATYAVPSAYCGELKKGLSMNGVCSTTCIEGTKASCGQQTPSTTGQDCP